MPTPSCAASQAIASSSSECSCSSANLVSASTRSKLSSFATDAKYDIDAKRDPSGKSSPRRYLPGEHPGREREVRHDAHVPAAVPRARRRLRRREPAGSTRSASPRSARSHALRRPRRRCRSARPRRWRKPGAGPSPSCTRSFRASSASSTGASGIGIVLVVEVDAVGAEPAQAGLARRRGSCGATSPARTSRRPGGVRTSWRSPPRPAGHRARRRGTSPTCPPPYISAVSKCVMPASSAACTTAREASSSIFIPKLLQPRPTTDTDGPSPPSTRSPSRS